jgi:hypothetical protein
MPVMVALNIVRVFAVLFLMLAAEGRLTGPFPYSAAWGDIITGVVAVPVLWLLKDGGARYTTAIAAWNLFGAADLVLAIAFGVTSAEGSPLQLFPGPGSEAMQARAVVVRSDRACPDLADPARDHCRAALARQTGPSGERGRLRARVAAFRSSDQVAHLGRSAAGPPKVV